jgi:cytoskeletal protein CcmA (bactofilin family)
MSSRTLTAAEFLRLVLADELRIGETCRVVGEISLRGQTLEHPLILHGFQFEGPVDLSDTSIPGELDISDCWFARTLTMTQVRVDGSVRLRRVSVMGLGGTVDMGGPPIFEAEGLSVSGNLLIEQVKSAGMLDIRDARVTGYALLRNVSASYLTASGLDVVADLTARDIRPERGATIEGARIGGDMFLAGWTIGLPGGKAPPADLRANGIAVTRHSQMLALDIDGRLSLSSGCFERGLWLSAIRVGGALELTNCRGAAIEFRADEPRSRIGRIEGYGLKVDLGFRLLNVDVGPDPAARDRVVVELQGIEADYLACYSLTAASDSIGRTGRFDGWTNIEGGMNLSGAHVRERIDLTGLACTGALELRDSHIGTCLRAWSPRTLLKDQDSLLSRPETPAGQKSALVAALDELKDHLRPSAGPEGGPAPRLPRPAHVARWDLERARIDGEADLTGLVLDGDLAAEGLQVGGAFLLADGSDVADAYARVGGQARLIDSRVGRLAVSGLSFLGDGWSSALILNGSTIGTLQIHPAADGDSLYPNPLGLENIKVSHWRLDGDPADVGRHAHDPRSRRTGSAETFERLLMNDRRISVPTYHGVIQTLSDNGRDRDSRRLYRHMRRRALKAEGGYNLFYRLYDLMLGFGTAPLRVGLLILAVTLVSALLITSHDPNLERRAMLKGQRAWAAQPPCSPVQKAVVTLRMIAPIQSGDVKGDCRLKDSGETELRAMGRNISTTPAEFGELVKILGFLLWPPFLAFLLRRAFRD